jgi:hypothetical protein
LFYQEGGISFFYFKKLVYTKTRSYPFVDGASTAARSRGKL